MTKRILSNAGFTLIEVMVALAVIAIALGALMNASANHSRSAGHLKQKTLAHYVAMNEIALIQAEQSWPDVGESNESSTLAGQEWFWKREVLKVLDPILQKPSTSVRHVRFTIYSDEEREHSLTRLSSYISKQITTP